MPAAGSLPAMGAYLDHAATGPMRPEAVEAMLPYLTDRFANPSGAHRAARDARRALDDAREELAGLLGAHPGEVIFTSGGTESDNLAVFGAGRGSSTALPTPEPADDVARSGVAVCTAVEHHAVLDAVLATGGRLVDVDRHGVLRSDHLHELLIEEGRRHERGEGPGVRLVSVMAVNNEIGTVQPLAQVAEVVRAAAPSAVLHTDAVQALCWTETDTWCAPADLLSLSAHKFGGPKGVGLLVARAGTAIVPRQVGGGQERGRRSGTQNVAGIVAMATAARLTVASRAEEIQRLGRLRDRLLTGLCEAIDDAVDTTAGAERVAGIAHLCIAGVETEALLFLLEREDVFASAASSCSSGALESSHVLAAMGVDRELARGSLRLSLGWSTTDAEIDHALRVIPTAVDRLRSFGL